MIENSYSRKKFLKTTGAAVGGSLIAGPVLSRESRQGAGKMRVALVGTGVRGVAMYGRDLVRNYGDHVEMVGICDANPGRVEYADSYIGAGCPTYTNLDEMLTETQPEWLIVTVWDWEHHNCIITGLEHGCNIICEKPLTIDETKAQAILDAERRYDQKIIVTFNYRYPPHRAKVKEILMSGAIGDIRSADFHWNIDHAHQQRYMQRWHGEERSGTLWTHKCTHHFDMLNWFLDSDPVEVYAQADTEIFGSNGPFRSTNCRSCPYSEECDYYWDITRSDHLTGLYVNNEHYDGYIRDNCVYRHNIVTADKHSALIKYANNAYVNYSLTSDTDHEGYWIAFNGTKGRLEGREGGWPDDQDHQEWILTPRGGEPEIIQVPFGSGGHWGGDPVMLEKLFVNPDMEDPLEQSAGTRDGVMSILIGIAARKSVESGYPVDIAGLTDLQLQAIRPKPSS